MEITNETHVGDIVKENYKTAIIFENQGIDFCCGGNKSLSAACEEADVNPEELISGIIAALEKPDADAKYFDTLNPAELSDYIVKRHHSYVNEHIPFLQQKLQKLCDVHGDNHPELYEIRELFEGAAGNLSMHMKKEELILFPLIKKIFKAYSDNVPLDVEARLESIIDVMHEEHSVEGKRFEKISLLASNYSFPPDGCSTFRVTYETLAEFEKDLHRHIHLENNILFSKAISMERELIKK